MTTEEKKGKRGVPCISINASWCKKCGICIEFCPASVFEAREADGFPVVVNPEACTWCQLCELRCPDLAIVLLEPDAVEGGS